MKYLKVDVGALPIVVLADAIVHEGTVVIVDQDAVIAAGAMR